jgi:flagellar basal body-associated protein FliL
MNKSLILKLKSMKRKKLLKVALMLVVAGIIIAGSIGLYMFFMPHRDVQKAKTDYYLTASGLVNEYLTDQSGANNKYLAEDGDSKILEVSGTVAQISNDFQGNKVIELKENGDKAGVNFTFMPGSNANAEKLQKGQKVTIKGVIRSGASYDPDLEMYLNAIVEKSDVMN